jgi:hypothetical protein
MKKQQELKIWINQTQFELIKPNLDELNSNWIDQIYETQNGSPAKVFRQGKVHLIRSHIWINKK